jgi:hypothetical protein
LAPAFNASFKWSRQSGSLANRRLLSSFPRGDFEEEQIHWLRCIENWRKNGRVTRVATKVLRLPTGEGVLRNLMISVDDNYTHINHKSDSSLEEIIPS